MVTVSTVSLSKLLQFELLGSPEALVVGFHPTCHKPTAKIAFEDKQSQIVSSSVLLVIALGNSAQSHRESPELNDISYFEVVLTVAIV